MRCPYCNNDDVHHFVGMYYVCNACGREFLNSTIDEPNTPRIDPNSLKNVPKLERWMK